MNINPEQLYTYKPLSSVRRTPASSNLKLIRNSVVVLDTYKHPDKDQGRLDLSLSHISLVEDRETKEIIVVYPRYYNSYKSVEWSTMRVVVE